MTPARIARHMLDCLARNDLSVFESYCHPEAQFFHAGIDGPIDCDQTRQMVAGFHAAFTDYALTVHDIIAEGDTVAVYCSSSATNIASYRGMPATGARVDYDEVMFLDFEGGRLIRSRKLHDGIALTHQLGMTLVPAADVSAAR